MAPSAFGEDQSQAKDAPSPGRVDPRNTLNELTGEQWLYFTKPLWVTSYPQEYGYNLRKAHGANKPPQLMAELIRFFTKSGDLVLDPFAGVGGTLIGASITEPSRPALGIEINQEWVDVYHRVCQEENLPPQELICGDCLAVMRGLPSESVAFIATDPPYNVQLRQTMAGDRRYQQHRNRHTDYHMYSDQARDLANLADYNSYLAALQEVLVECFRLLRPRKYLVLILRDSYQNGRYLMTHADVARRAEQVGFVLKGDTIWYQAGARLRPYGYPYAYVPNIVYQHLLILRKP